jgi:hypothetical protein
MSASHDFPALLTRIAREVEAILDEARARDPDFDAKVSAFIGDADGCGLRAVADLQPTPAFRVEVLRQKGASIDGHVVFAFMPPPRSESPSPLAH